MAQTSKIRVTFISSPQRGSQISVFTKNVATNELFFIAWTYADSLPSDQEIQVGTFEEAAQRFSDAFLLEFQTGYTTEVLAYEVIITSINTNFVFTGGLEINPFGIPSTQALLSLVYPENLFVTGIESSNYYLNNEIWIDLSSTVQTTHFIVSVTDLSNGKFITPLKLYANNNTTSINLQSVFKALFDIPMISNVNKFKVVVRSYNGEALNNEVTLYKNILRGGKRTEETNISVPFNTILRSSAKLPTWQGYPTLEYYLSDVGTILTREPSDRDFKRAKNCNSLYFRFLNQQGGYSNWLFESWSKGETNKPLGAYSIGRTIADLGNEVENSLEVFSKVSKEYYQTVQDLFISPEIYIWENLRWVRVFSGKNASEYDPAKKAYGVKAKFDYENRFNPSVLWSN